MRKTTLFIAMSLDGYIADVDGGVDWLDGHGDDEDAVDSYAEFSKNIDTVLMGWNTYHQVVTELSPDEWVYQDFTTYVFTHGKHLSSDRIRFVDEDPAAFLDRLKGEKGEGIWICGGANLARQLARADAIDEYYISIIPVLLGEGIRLFDDWGHETKLRFRKARSYNGIVDLVYERR